MSALPSAARRHGMNVDSGAIEYAVALVCIAPAAMLFALASCSSFRMWRIRWFAHWLAVACLLLPPVLMYRLP